MAFPVTFRQCRSYDRTEVEHAVEQIFGDLGGAKGFFSSADCVLLKPNFLKDDPRQKGVITHPEVIRAVAKVALDSGCRVKIGDSPGFGSIAWILKRSGFDNFFSDLPVEIVPFKNPVEVRNPKGTFKKFVVDREILEADRIINMPKLKTHGQMLISMAVKNMFGAVIGAAKPQWHLRAGINYSYFARMLLELHYLIKPALNLIDGITGMEGEGPSAGDPVDLGFLAAGTDAVALDSAICDVLRIDKERVLTIKVADELFHDRGPVYDNCGDDPGLFIKENFRLPDIVSLETLNIAPWLGKYLKNALTTRPLVLKDDCVLCGACMKQCPTGVMKVSTNGKRPFVKIDYRNCIRCFCCQEICPQEAIKIKKGWLLRLTGKRSHP